MFVVIVVPVVSIIAGIAIKTYRCIEVTNGNPVVAVIHIVRPLIAAACTAAFMTAAALMKTHNSFLRILGKLCPVLIIYEKNNRTCDNDSLPKTTIPDMHLPNFLVIRQD